MVRTVEGHLLTMARPLAESFGLHRGRIYALGSDVKQLTPNYHLRELHATADPFHLVNTGWPPRIHRQNLTTLGTPPKVARQEAMRRGDQVLWCPFKVGRCFYRAHLRARVRLLANRALCCGRIAL